ncbi:hypothetical protein EXIGLDRAFT_720206 [Exidia glandulosa HHB12029]|uniref:Conserved oligomeric Golgi complex subunit 2 n=1 Tax=Exidia glandulosa HHB12029 TaxID=1314781 RepID=A0A165GJA0_EXIGL|nr:hypothetical protein EXIGLDRAFT_720206 [Exidia glandulosa HHB12029]
MPKEPFELERLASELGVDRDDEQDGAFHALPTLEPLSHEHAQLKAPSFNAEDFLLSRAYTSLPDLGTELKEYLARLKEELVQLINDDYEAFISLSTDLRGEGARLERLHFPLPALRKEIELSTAELKQVQDAVQEKLQERAAIREEKALLHLLLKISESVQRLEGLLLLPSPPDESGLDANGFSSPVDGLSDRPNAFTAQDDDGLDDRGRRGRGKHVARVGAEYTQMLYDVEKARGEGCAFVDTLQWRIDRIKTALSSDLDHFFASTLQSLILPSESNKPPPMEKARLSSDLNDCFKTYDLLKAWREAEEVVRRTIVKPFVRQTVFSGALAVPHSPLMPRTPYPNSAFSPMTPATPFTPFPRQYSAVSPGASGGILTLQLLDDAEDSLARLFNKLLRFVERDLALIFEVSERVSAKHKKTALLPTTNGDAELPPDTERFEILANVVFDEIGRALGDELGTTLFAAGRPDIFRNHFATSSNFVTTLESLAPSSQSIQALRVHPSYMGYQKRWQLPVYFQLRWKDIVVKVEDALAAPQPTLIRDGPNSQQPFFTHQASAVVACVATCWGDEVYIPDLGHRFWRLTLQILSRFRTWLDVVASSKEPKTTLPRLEKDIVRAASPVQRAGTPVAGAPSDAASVQAEDSSLRDCAALIADIKQVEQSMKDIWKVTIKLSLPLDEDDEEAEEALDLSLASLSERIPDLSNQIVAVLTRRCKDGLTGIVSIPSHFRAMTQRRDVSEPSPFVSNTLRPLKTFFDNVPGGEALRSSLGPEWSRAVFEGVAAEYYTQVVKTKKQEEALRRLKQPRRATGFSLFGGGAGRAQDDTRADERIQAQIVLDVETLGKDAAGLGVDVESSEAYRMLKASAASWLAGAES